MQTLETQKMHQRWCKPTENLPTEAIISTSPEVLLIRCCLGASRVYPGMIRILLLKFCGVIYFVVVVGRACVLRENGSEAESNS